jgi:hypothetical protein
MSAAVLMGAAGTFYSAFPKVDLRSLLTQQASLAQAASFSSAFFAELDHRSNASASCLETITAGHQRPVQ